MMIDIDRFMSMTVAQRNTVLREERAAKTTTERVQKLRADRDALGLKRLELYAHPDDWPAIKALAEKLQKRRARDAGKQKAP
jgi:Fic family protein